MPDDATSGPIQGGAPTRPQGGPTRDTSSNGLPLLPEDFTLDMPIAEFQPAVFAWDGTLAWCDRQKISFPTEDIPKTMWGLMELEYRAYSPSGFKATRDHRRIEAKLVPPQCSLWLTLMADLMDARIKNSPQESYWAVRKSLTQDDKQGETRRLNTTLTPRADLAVQYVQEVLGCTQTDALNRGAQLLADGLRAQAAGGGVLIQDDSEAAPFRVRIY